MGTLELSGTLFSALYCWIIPVPSSSSNYTKDDRYQCTDLMIVVS